MHARQRKLLWLGLSVFVVCFALMIILGVRSMQQTIAENPILEENINPIDSFRTVRQQLRAMQKAQLNDIAHDETPDDEISAMAQRELMALYARDEQEITLEGILKMRGWMEPVVTVHTDSVNVLLQAETITQQESSIILDLVCRETGILSGNVKIIPIK